MAILLSNEELDALQGCSYFLFQLYARAIRRYMDYQTGIVGIKRRISYQSLSEEMYIEPESGVDKRDTGSPTKARLQRGIKRLQEKGIIEQIENKKYLIFRCVLAKQDKSVQNQADTRSIHQVDTICDTPNHQEKPAVTRVSRQLILQADTQVDTPKNTQADTPPLSGKEKDKQVKSTCLSKKKRLPDDFFVTQHHVDLAVQNQWPNPYDELEAFKDYHLARGTLFSDWDRAFYTWLRNAKRFKAKENFNGQHSGNKQNSMSRAINNILNSPTRSRSSN